MNASAPPSPPAGPLQRRLARAAGLAPLLLLCAACNKGYPERDAPALDPEEMSAGQRLVLMNEIGAEAHAERRWHYTLGPGCELRIRATGEGRPQRVATIDLLGTRILTIHDQQDGTFDVRATPTTTPPATTPASDTAAAAEQLSVLESERWTDAMRLEWLLQLTQGECRAGLAGREAPRQQPPPRPD